MTPSLQECRPAHVVVDAQCGGQVGRGAAGGDGGGVDVDGAEHALRQRAPVEPQRLLLLPVAHARVKQRTVCRLVRQHTPRLRQEV